MDIDVAPYLQAARDRAYDGRRLGQWWRLAWYLDGIDVSWILRLCHDQALLDVHNSDPPELTDRGQAALAKAGEDGAVVISYELTRRYRRSSLLDRRTGR